MPAIDLLNSLNQKYNNSVSGLSAQNVKTAIDEIALRNLGQFAPTSSSQLLSVITDETGSGSLVFGTSPTITSPTITDGSINNTSIGSVTAASGRFTTLESTGNLIVGGNLTVNGTTTTVNSTTITVDDPVFTLGGDVAPTADDNKDRGIEFRWHDGTAARTGFFGFDDSTGFFTFIPSATNSSEVFSGTTGVLDVTRITGSAASLTTARTISLSGDVTGSASFDGTANITIAATIASNSVALGADTTGDYVATASVSGNGLTGSATGEGSTFTVTSNATSANTASTIVFRDASGNFSAGTITATSFSGSGASLTNLTAGNLSGTIPSAVLGNSTLHVGTTAIALNRASANLGLTGISSVTFPGATSGTISLQPTAVAGTNTLTLPAVTGTIATLADTPQTFAGDTTFSKAFTVASTTQDINLGTSQSTGNISIGGLNATGVLSFGRSDQTQTVNIASGSTVSGSTKSVNIGNNGAAGSTTNIGIGGGSGTVNNTISGTTNTLNATSNVINGATTFNNGVTMAVTTGNINLGTSQTTGALTIGGPGQTGSIIVGQSDQTQIVEIADGATASGSTKSVNIGLNGVAGSTTNIVIGNTTGSSTRVDGAFALAATTENISLATAQTTGQLIVGGTAQTGTIQIGRSTASQALNLATAVTASGSTKTVEIGTNGAAGSTTSITIGGANSTTTTNIFGATTNNGSFGVNGSISNASASGILTRTAATQDGVRLLGRAGGTGNFVNILTTGTLAADVTNTLPTTSGTLATLANVTQSFNGPVGFNNSLTALGTTIVQNANGLVILPAATQDAINVRGRAGGTGSFVNNLTTDTLTASVTNTLPAVSGTLATTANVAQTFAGDATFNGSFSLGATTQAINLGTSQTTGTFSIGGVTGTGNIIIGRSDQSQTISIGDGILQVGRTRTIQIGQSAINGSSSLVLINSNADNSDTLIRGASITLGNSAASSSINIGVGASATGQTKTVLIGTNGAAGSTTNVTIGSTAGTSSITINGNTTHTGNVTAVDFNSTSDLRAKTNIEQVSGLAIVNQLRGVEFDFIDTGKHSSGVIAQEIEKIIPHVVDSSSVMKTVSYQQIIAYLIEGMKEQQIQIDTLRKEIETLKNV